MTRFSRAKAILIDHLDQVVPELFIKRYQRGGSWMVLSPGSNSRRADQMVIWRTGARAGGWTDFITGEKGDAIDLIAYVQFGGITKEARMDAVAWIEDRFGIREMDPAKRADIEAAHEKRSAKLKKQDEVKRQDNRERARKMFFLAEEKVIGSKADIYLKGRGIHLGQVKHLTQSFRFNPECQYWLSETRPKPLYPALVSAMVDVKGHLRACHTTYLAQDGKSKAPVEKTKLMWPEVAGLAIRVSNGASALGAERQAEQSGAGIVAITEGIEDALSLALSRPDLRCWAAGSLPNLLHLPDHDCAAGWLIFKDNDWGKPQAEALFGRAVSRIKSFGKPVEIVSMPAEWGKDVNDALNH